MTDDRYRVNQGVEEILEALHHVAQDYGTQIDPDERVAIARVLRSTLAARSGPLTRSDILRAFQQFEMRRPPNGWATAVIRRLERLDPRAVEALEEAQ